MYARADGVRTRAYEETNPQALPTTTRAHRPPEAIWPRSLWQFSLSIRLIHHVLTVLAARICNNWCDGNGGGGNRGAAQTGGDGNGGGGDKDAAASTLRTGRALFEIVLETAEP